MFIFSCSFFAEFLFLEFFSPLPFLELELVVEEPASLRLFARSVLFVSGGAEMASVIQRGASRLNSSSSTSPFKASTD